VLSSVSRTLNFRVTVRDNVGGAGCTGEDNMVVTVSGAAGPFLVTAPNTAVTWQGNSNQTVTWNVAGSNGGAVNCANVEIALSTDGGFNYSVVLGSTPNDGSQSIVVPNVSSSDCRIRVMGVGNIFYDISNVDFTITMSLPVELLAFTARLKDKNTALLNWATASETDNKGFEIQHAVKQAGGLLTFSTIGFVDGQGTSLQKNDYTFEVKDLDAGEHYFRLYQIDFDGEGTFSPVQSMVVRSDFFVKTLPNPVQDELEVQIYQEEASSLSISLVNQWGQETALLTPREVQTGQTFWRFNLSNLSKGTYYLVCRRGQGQEERKLLMKR
jgi:hypothetical protein